ncbi:MAG: hypothetical protein PWQ91_798 [Eubacteriales bacterium]|nr:hypothetical protein [Eubacteriales bacterium]MDN5363737.1 hypothetical protein [Eubacteriales bacterium]
MSVTHILESIKKAGYKITPQRRAIVQILLKAAKPLTAAEISQQLQPLFPDTSQDTVYRNLRLLAELGLVAQIRSSTAYSDCFELLKEHHCHLVCLGCGNITCLPGCPVDGWQPPSHVLGDFWVTGHSFEVHGYCSRCQRERGEGLSCLSFGSGAAWVRGAKTSLTGRTFARPQS